MSIFVDSTYIGMMGPRLNLFRQVNQNLFNFRCNICGDSERNEFKRRAYFYKNKTGDGYSFQCHNCQASHSLYTYIDLCFPEYLKQYKFEKFSSSGSAPQMEVAIPFKKLEVVTDGIMPMDMLPRNHKAVKYLIDSRKLPESLLENFFHVDKYVEWLKETVQDPDLTYTEHSRILIPFTNKMDQIYRYVARSYDCNIAAKYLFTDLDLGSNIYNFYHIDQNELVYVVEGQIDAMLLGKQAIALGNAKYSKNDLTFLKNFVIVPDNECRNPDIVKSLGKAIDSGMKVCIWPKFYGKDINDMVLNGISVDEIKKLISDNTYHGIIAKMKFNQWSRI